MSEKPSDGHLHDGHRIRMRRASEADPDLTSFSDYQTLEFILSFLIPRRDTNKIAHNLIDTFGSLNAVFQASTDELFAAKGMTENAACFLSHFNSFMRKSEMSRRKPKPILKTVEDAVEVLWPYFYERNEERVYCAALDQNDKALQIVLVSEGLGNNVTINNNKIFALVTRTKAKKLVIAHNHPAGFVMPSDEDVGVTKMLFTMLPSLGAVLSDHIIFTDSEYFSFYNEHILDKFAEGMDNIFGYEAFKEMRFRRFSNQYVLEPKMAEPKDTEEEK